MSYEHFQKSLLAMRDVFAIWMTGEAEALLGVFTINMIQIQNWLILATLESSQCLIFFQEFRRKFTKIQPL